MAGETWWQRARSLIPSGEALPDRLRLSARRLLLFALGLLPFSLLLSGCFGVSQNPSYFPYLLPTGDIIQTHARPPGPGYYANFDPHAVRLEVRPVVATNPVRTQHVLIATVYDEKGKPRRNRRVEWMVEGVGNIVEVDESGYFPGRGYKVDNHYAVSYTNFCEHRITRGNCDPNDDFVVRPGQSWCVISSAVEGDTHVTVYAPEINDWDKHKVFVTCHWVDAEWTLPPPAAERAGGQHVLTTQVFRHTDRQPLANYRVRYKILDGPPAVLLPSRTQEYVAITDLRGNAHVTLAQAQPAAGINRVGVEIIRPPDPSLPSSAGIVIGHGTTSVEWLAPSVALTKTGPASAARGQDIPYTITVTNNGRVETRSMTVQDLIPEGLTYVRSQPPAIQEGRRLTWTFGLLPPGQAHAVQLVLRSDRAGQVMNCATVTTEEGLRAENCVTTQITEPQLKVTLGGPAIAVLGGPLTYQITVTNPGSGPAANVVLKASFDQGLAHESKANPVELHLGTLEGGQSRTVPLILTPSKLGRLVTRVVARADGGLRDQAEAAVTVQNAQVALKLTGRPRALVGKETAWDIEVTNTGEVPVTNLLIHDRLPPEVAFLSASEGGQVVSGEVEWRFAALQPREKRVVKVTGRAEKLAKETVDTATVTADSGIRQEDRATLEIIGLPAYRFQVTSKDNPVEVGKQVTYEIVVTNTGSLPANKVVVKVVLPNELKLLATEPAQPTLQGQTVTFAPVNGIQPNQSQTYVIRAEAMKPGDIRFQAELTGEGLQLPVHKEASTNIYNPAAPPGPAEAKPLPPGPKPPEVEAKPLPR